jgi:hypothetical protein
VFLRCDRWRLEDMPKVFKCPSSFSPLYQMNTRPDIKLFQTPRNSTSNTRKLSATGTVRMFGDLNTDRRLLVSAMQKNPFSRIENLQIKNGNPVFGPATRWTAETKLGSADSERQEVALPNFALKRELIELFSQFDVMGNGVILVLEVRAGLPFRIIREVVV